MNKRMTSTLVLCAVFSALVLNGCGKEVAAPGADPGTSIIASAARNLEERDAGNDARDVSVRERSYRARFMTVLDALRAVPALSPLFDMYQVPDPVVYDDREPGLTALLRAVRIALKSEVVTITNRQTGGIIFSGALDALAEGTFQPEQMPGGTGTPPPPPQECAFDYSEWSPCDEGGAQTRTVLASSPEGCTGTPVTSQSCTYVPPVTACTEFTYSNWSACAPDGTQARTLLTSSPAGCTGGSPEPLTQSCTYVPPVPTCTSFTYSNWSACAPDGTQARTLLTSSPAGCTGGSPEPLTRSCTYTPPTPACGSCHGIPPSSGRHSRHSFASCSTCHGSGYSATTTNSATHDNGATDVASSMGYSGGTCATAGCHGSRSW